MTSGENVPAGDAPERKDEDRWGPIGWVYRRYQDYDKWSGRWDWLSWLVEMWKTHTAVSVAATSTAAVTVAGGIIVADPELRERYLPFLAPEKPPAVQTVAAIPPAPPPPAEPVAQTVATESWGSSLIFPIEGRDATGRRAAFDIAVLPSDLTWARKSSSELEQNGGIIAKADVPARIFSGELRTGLSRSQAYMAVGLASQEGRQDEEAQRADRRSQTAAGWLASVVEAERPIWTLNLGQYKGGCKAAESGLAGTAWQRPVIVVGIRPDAADVRLDEAFADAMSGKSNLPSRECYTNFDLKRFR
jgi:hypothetical protein